MYNKVVSIILCCLCSALFLSACDKFSYIDESDEYKFYEELNIGEEFSLLRDGYAVKVNDSILIWHNLDENENDEVKYIDREDVDLYNMGVLNGSEEIFRDKFKCFYASDDYVVLFLKKNENTVLIKCKDNIEYEYFSDITALQTKYKDINYQNYVFVDLQ